MGANCPAAVPCLLVGCLRGCSNNSKLGVASVRQLAALSRRETARALALLQRRQCLEHLQLELALLLGDPIAVSCLLTKHLSMTSAMVVAAGNDTTKSQRRKSVAVDGPDHKPPAPKSLREHLEASPNLLARTLGFLTTNLSPNDNPTTIPISWSSNCFSLTSITWLLCRVSLQRLAIPKHQDMLVACFAVLQRLMEDLQTMSNDDTQHIDRPLSLLACAIVSTVASLISLQLDDELKQKVESSSVQILKNLFGFPAVSKPTTILFGRLSTAMNTADPGSLCDAVDMVVRKLSMAKELTTSLERRHTFFLMRMSNLCDWVYKQSILAEKTVSDLDYDTSLIDPSLAIQILQCERVSDTKKSVTAKTLLDKMLTDEPSAHAFLQHPLAATFVELGTLQLLKGESSKVPLVLPMQIAKQAMVLDLPLAVTVCSEKESLFLVQLLYCFVFLEQEPASPFKFDPRVLPLREAYDVCERSSLSTENARFSSKLKAFVNRFCPEVKQTQRMLAITLANGGGALQNTTKTQMGERNKSELIALLRKSTTEPKLDPCGLLAEKAFLVARTFLCDADLFAVGISGLLSRPHTPAVFFTYPILYRDPLVVLKCPGSVWGRRGTRRIALVILDALLEANEYIVRMAPYDDTREEYLSSRNEVVVRALLSVVTSSSVKLDGSNYLCGLTGGLIRKLIARQRGLSALLIKQNLSETQLDWMIESAPETMEDAMALANVLADRTSLTAAERLVAADGVLRLAIAHGYRYPSEAEAMAYAALSHLIAAFFLIIGPVGVPVNALVGEGNLDATQVSRKAAFRMLKALQKVRGYRVRLRNECVLSLQKFAGMCKGEGIVGNIQSAVTNRQKTLLKELIDMVMKALDAMGGSTLV